MLVDEINIKLLICGEGGVGKTSIVNSFLEKDFPKMYIPTIGSNIAKKEYNLKKSSISLKLSIWDIGGQKSFNPLSPVYFNNLDAVFLVFDLTKPEDTLLEIKNTYLKKVAEFSKNCVKFLVGNKLDLINNKSDLIKIIDKLPLKNIPLIFISAKMKENIEEAFELIIFNYLQELARQIPKDKYKGLAIEFLEIISKEEQDLKSLLVNLENIDSLKLQGKPVPPITKKVVETEKEEVKNQIYKDVKQRLKKLEMIKNQIIETFNNNLSAMEDVILSLKNTPIGSLINAIDNAAEQMNYLKDDFELKLDSLLSLEKSEGEQQEGDYELEKEKESNKEVDKEIEGE